MTGTGNPWRERMIRWAEREGGRLSPLYRQLALDMAGDAGMIQWVTEAAGGRAQPQVVFSAFHYLLLRDGPSHELGAFFATMRPGPQTPAGAFPAFRDFWARHRDALASLIATRNTQTNEVGRCTYLLPALVAASALLQKPLHLIDLGTSAGLNLLFDRYHYDYGGGFEVGNPASPVRLRTELAGAAPAVGPFPATSARIGIDLAPIDVADDDATLWLQACVWPEHLDRMRNLRAALAVARLDPPRIVAGNAVDILAQAAAEAAPGAALVITHTNVLPYFHAAELVRLRELIHELSAGRDLAWVAAEPSRSLEAAGFEGRCDPLREEDGALPLILSTVIGGRRDHRVLGVTGAHARWLDWHSA